MPEPVLPEVDPSAAQAPLRDQNAEDTPSRSSVLVFVLLLLIALLVFCLAAGTIAAVLYFQFRPEPAAAPQAQAPLSTPSQEIQHARQAEAMDAANFRADEMAVVRERISAQLHATNNIQENIDTLRNEISSWQDTVLPLMTGEQGKAIAAAPRLLDDFLALYQEELPAPDLLDSFEARLQPLVDHLHTARDVQDARHYRPTDEFIASLDALAADVRTAITAYRRHNRLLAAILLRATPPQSLEGLPTLEAAMNKLEQDRKIEDLQFISEELEALRRENREKLRDAIAEKETKVTESQVEAEKKLGELEAQKIITAVDQQLSQFKQPHDELQRIARFQAALPEIRASLAPFFAASLYQPSSSGPVETNKKAPVSWSALQSSGALEATETGLAILTMTITYAKDRPKHGWDGTPPKTHLLRAQELLKEFGPQLAAKGMLSE